MRRADPPSMDAGPRTVSLKDQYQELALKNQALRERCARLEKALEEIRDEAQSLADAVAHAANTLDN